LWKDLVSTPRSLLLLSITFSFFQFSILTSWRNLFFVDSSLFSKL
jgi:hypothetical protein